MRMLCTSGLDSTGFNRLLSPIKFHTEYGTSLESVAVCRKQKVEQEEKPNGEPLEWFQLETPASFLYCIITLSYCPIARMLCRQKGKEIVDVVSVTSCD